MLRSPASPVVQGVPLMATTIGTSIRKVSTSQTANSTDTTLLCDASSAPVTITLPPAASNLGRIIGVKKTDSSANFVTAKGNAAELIDGSNANNLSAQYQYIFIQCDGSAWWII